MPQQLRAALRETLQGWRSDIPPAWQAVLDGVEPAYEDVDPVLMLQPWEPIFPTRKGDRIPGAPAGAHIFRGLDGTRPDRVKAVVIGQDPYPHVARATGRAFEPGDQKSWPADLRGVASSMRRITQAAAYAISGDSSYIGGDEAWPGVARAIVEGDVDLPTSPRRMFDRWQKRGLLWLNVGLTLTRYKRGGHPHQLEGHIPLWKPVVRAILKHLATRDRGHVVFLLWGKPAREAFAEFGIVKAAREAGTWQSRVRALRHGHPSARPGGDGVIPFFRSPNPFTEASRLLREMGGRAIKWD